MGRFNYKLVDWFTRPKSVGRALMSVGALLLGVRGVFDIVLIYNGFEVSVSDNATPAYVYFIAASLIVFGLVISLLDWFKERGTLKLKYKGIVLKSLSQANPPRLEQQFPDKVESSRTASKLNLVQQDGESIEDWLNRSVINLSEFSKKELPDLYNENSGAVLAVGGVAHVPHLFALGFLISNRRNVNFYCWDRSKKHENNFNWVNVSESFSKKITPNMALVRNGTKPVIKKLGLSVEMSFANDEQNFMDSLNLDAVVKIELGKQKVGNLFCQDKQNSIIESIRDYLNSDIFSHHKAIEELHFTITGQGSFVLRLATDFNQNHIPQTIKVHHYHSQNNQYPWSLVMHPNDHNIQFEIKEKV